MAIKVGDTVILKYDNKLELVDVFRVTPAGFFKVRGVVDLFKPAQSGWGDNRYYEQKGKYSKAICYEYTPELWQKMLQNKAEYEQQQRKEREERDEKKAAREKERIEQIVWLKSWFELTPENSIRWEMDDDSIVYTIKLPVKPEYAERKKGWEIVMITIRPSTHAWLGPSEKYEYTVASKNGSDCSVSSTNTRYSATTEEALWETIRNCYESW